MKKATNSKKRGKISKLFPIMQEHLGKSTNLARIKLMTFLLEALVKVQTVNLVRLSNAMPTAVDKESNMRRLQRFLGWSKAQELGWHSRAEDIDLQQQATGSCRHLQKRKRHCVAAPNTSFYPAS